MNRVSARSAARNKTNALERRINLLTGLVIVQTVLLIVLIAFQFYPYKPVGSGSDLSDYEQTEAISGDETVTGEGVPVDEVDVEQSTVGDDELQAQATNRNEMLPPEVEPVRPVRVEIRNGCGVRGLAGRYAQVLRNEGFDVRDTRNADRMNYQSSRIIDLGVLEGAGAKLASELGIEPGQVVEQADPDLVDVDAVLILGRDYETFKLQP